MAEVVEAATVLDVRRTFGFLRMGKYDPTCTLGEDTFAKTFMVDARTVVRHTIEARGGSVRVTIEGDAPGAAAWSAQLPVADGHDAFAARREPLFLRRIAHALPGLRFVRVPWLFDLACGIILQQRVTYEEAIREYQGIVRRYGTTTELGSAFPSAHTIARLAPAQLQQLGIDMRRATTLVRTAREHAVHHLFDLPREDLVQRFSALSGIGPWTIGMLLAYGGGDEDAVPVGDLHLPHTMCQALANERRGDDERMLELLAPYAGQRARVVRMVLNAKMMGPVG